MKRKNVTIDNLAVIIQRGFNETAKNLNNLFRAVDKRFDLVDKRFEKIEKRFFLIIRQE
jgi:hypothetical protein